MISHHFKTKSLKDCKKGFGIIGLGLFVLVMLIVIGTFFLYTDSYFKSIYSTAETFVDYQPSKDMITNASASHSSYWDTVYAFLLIGLWSAGLIIGYYSDNGRFALVFMVFLFAILLYAAGILTGYWNDSLSQNVHIASRNLYPFIYFILDQLAITLLVLVGSSILVGVMKDSN
jgi:hypothetical protein